MTNSFSFKLSKSGSVESFCKEDYEIVQNHVLSKVELKSLINLAENECSQVFSDCFPEEPSTIFYAYADNGKIVIIDSDCDDSCHHLMMAAEKALKDKITLSVIEYDDSLF